MANEARVFVEGVQNCLVRQFTIADGTAIAKGSLLVYGAASRTGIIHTAFAFHRPLGFTTSEKEANDGKTTIGVQRTGVVDAFIDGPVETGDIVIASRTTINRVERLASGNSFSRYEDLTKIVGRALESGADGTQIKIALTLG